MPTTCLRHEILLQLNLNFHVPLENIYGPRDCTAVHDNKRKPRTFFKMGKFMGPQLNFTVDLSGSKILTRFRIPNASVKY